MCPPFRYSNMVIYSIRVLGQKIRLKSIFNIEHVELHSFRIFCVSPQSGIGLCFIAAMRGNACLGVTALSLAQASLSLSIGEFLTSISLTKLENDFIRGIFVVISLYTGIATYVWLLTC